MSVKPPSSLIEKIKPLLKDQIESFKASMNDVATTSVRLHPYKSNHELHLTEPIAWHSGGYYLDERPKFTLDPYHHAGHYYVQEASSMLIGYIIKQFDFPKDAKALDACAAPGGKSTLLCDVLGADALIHSNEVNGLRAESLRQNIQRWGYSNCIVTNATIAHLSSTGITYDLILVDAPCSGEGMMRKEQDAIEQWNQNKIDHCFKLQTEITKLIPGLCHEGTIVIYSTCTFNLQENEDVVRQLTQEYPFEQIEIDFPKQWNIHDHGTKTYRCFPHLSKGEGFSFSVMRYTGLKRKKEPNKNKLKLSQSASCPVKMKVPMAYMQKEQSWIASSEPLFQMATQLQEFKCKTCHYGIHLGQFKREDWIPHHSLSMSFLQDRNEQEAISLNLEQAQNYLRAIDFYHEEVRGSYQWILVNYKDAVLGWAKVIQGKLKNYYPKELRIYNL
ncbi:MAG TPA: hypothetical protein PK006_05440 [Saprospiraceae bacterium]|nr:hypothetical protein [Saprospiraceae bacterium]